jgi:hypothetical protein
MAVPPEFSETEHLQNLIRRYINKAVREDFSDLGGDDWDPDLTTTRGSMRHGLTHQDNDSMQVTLARMFLYYFTFGKALKESTLIEMTDRLYEDFTYRPEIKLYFSQSRFDAEKGVAPVHGQITYRLINETSATLTPANVKTRANKIKTLFAEPSLFVWHKGKRKYTYLDIPNGYDIRILTRDETEAKRVIEQFLDIENKTPDFDKLTEHNPSRTYPSATQTKLIYGKQRKVPRWRPTEDVKFRYASIKIHGLPFVQYIVDARDGITRVNVPD